MNETLDYEICFAGGTVVETIAAEIRMERNLMPILVSEGKPPPISLLPAPGTGTRLKTRMKPRGGASGLFVWRDLHSRVWIAPVRR